MQNQYREHVGVVGLDGPGQRLAQRLLQFAQEEITLCVFDQQSERMAPLIAQGAYRAPTLREVGRQGGIVFVLAASDQEILQIALGDGRVLRQLGADGILVSFSTGSPEVSTQLARIARQEGCAYLTAMVCEPSEITAHGTLSMVLSGDAAAKMRVRPLLACMSERVYDLGERVEATALARIASAFLRACAIEAIGEAAALIDGYGLDRKHFLRLLAAPPFSSGAVYEQDGSHMIGPRDFSDTQFSVTRGLNEVGFALKAGRMKGLAFPCADVVYEHLLAARSAGRAEEHWSVLSEFAGPGVFDALSSPSSLSESSAFHPPLSVLNGERKEHTNAP